MRRTLRIFPVYYLFLGICFLLMPLLIGGDESITNGASPWWYFLYGSNYMWVAEDTSMQGWLAMPPVGDFAMPEYLGITWSLAVEEQFYLFWPVIVYAFARRLNRPILFIITLVILTRVILVLTIVEWADATYMASICRVDSLLMGAGLAWYARSNLWNPQVWKLLINVGLFVCLPVVFCYQLAFPGRQDPLFSMFGYSLVGLGFTGLLAYVTQDEKGIVGNLFRGRFLTWMGKYSYGLYLYHMLVWAVSHHLMNAEVTASGTPLHPEKFSPIGGSMLIDAPLRMLLCSLITAVIAWVSYRFFEQYFINMKKRF